MKRGEATHREIDAQAGTTHGLDLKVCVSKIRAKFRAAGIPVQIVNIWGKGYRLQAPEA